MTQIDDWTPVFPRKGELSSPAGTASASAKAAANPVDAIHDGLMKIKPRPPVAVHCYRGEGLRWIRVGFDGDQPIAPSLVGQVGRLIEACVPKESLFFNALRPYDMLFFLEGGDPASIGLPARYFGVRLDELLPAWESDPPVTARKRAHSMAAAPYSQRSRAKR